MLMIATRVWSTGHLYSLDRYFFGPTMAGETCQSAVGSIRSALGRLRSYLAGCRKTIVGPYWKKAEKLFGCRRHLAQLRTMDQYQQPS